MSADHARAGSGGEGEDDERDAAHRTADLGHEVEHRHPGAGQRGQRDAEDEADGGHHDPGDGRHQDRAGEVLADHAVAEPAHPVGPGAVARRHQGPQAADEALAVEEEGHRGEDGGGRGEGAADDRATGVLHRRGVAGQPLGQLVEEALDAVGHVGVP